MTSLPALHGKTLPIFFAQGYFDGLWHAVGNAQRIAAYQIAAHTLVPDKTLCKQWSEPLLAYVGHSALSRQPLDYRYVALFQSGFQLTGLFQIPERAKGFTTNAGRAWWYGEPPISTYLDTTGLQRHFTPRIWAALNNHKFGAPGLTPENFKGYSDLGTFAVTTFLEVFQEESGVALRTDVRSDCIEFEVLDCPFCLKAHEGCYVWHGLVEGLLAWLYGHWREEHPGLNVLKLNPFSTNHQIFISVKR